MIARYTRSEMGRIWSNENKFRMWLAVELAATATLAEAGLVPKKAAREIRQKADFNLNRIFAIEKEVKHDVIAFTTAVAEQIGPASRWLHYGLTSNDVVDTAQALLLRAGLGAHPRRTWSGCWRSWSAAPSSSKIPRRSAARTASMPSPSPSA